MRLPADIVYFVHWVSKQRCDIIGCGKMVVGVGSDSIEKRKIGVFIECLIWLSVDCGNVCLWCDMVVLEEGGAHVFRERIQR